MASGPAPQGEFRAKPSNRQPCIYYADSVYVNMRWTPLQIVFNGIIEDDSEGDVVTISIGTPSGEILFLAEIDFEGRTLIACGVHVQSEASPNSIGRANLLLVAETVLARLDFDEAIIEGAVRTTGANSGHRPKQIRITRRRRD